MKEGPAEAEVNQTEAEPHISEKPAKRFRKPLRIVVAVVVLAALLLWGISMLAQPFDRTRAAYTTIVIEEDSGISEAAEVLEEEGIIKSASRFEMLSKLAFAGSIRPGTYFLSPSMDSFQILHTLTNGLTTSEGFTIPAGYTVDQVATALSRDGLADKEEFLKAASSPDIAKLDVLCAEESGLKGSDLVEGFLFPSDYILSSDADESMMVIMMIDALSNFFNDDFRARADELGMSIRDVIIVASIIEKETSVDKERAAISAVIHNRYNLELMKPEEIPKKPLCSPGSESITAALYPEENEYTHYVLSSRLDGTHIFTDDDEEYERLLEEYNEAKEARKDMGE